MKNFSLKWKITAVGLVPLFFLLAVVGFGVWDNYQKYNEAKSLASKMGVIEAASAVVHESQKERGASAAFINGGVKQSFVAAQQERNNSKIAKLKDVLQESSFDESYKNELFENIERYDNLRSGVLNKSLPLGQVLKTYSSIIARFLKIEVDVANQTSLASIAAKLRAFRILEDSKESGGKLRANMSAILAKNKPISDKKFAAIVDLKAGVDSGLKSSGLVLDSKAEGYVNDFFSSSQWKTVNNTFSLILKNSEKGGYYQDSKAFFGIITEALNILGTLIIYQKDTLKADVAKIQKQAVTSLWQIALFSSLFFIGVFFFIMKTSNMMTKSIMKIVGYLSESSQTVTNYSNKIADSSGQLSSAATQQASFLQETVSSIDEISSMVQRNADSATTSTQVSSKSTEAASTGKKKVEEMIQSIKDISKSNDDIMVEMKNNNSEISKIIHVISEIGDKTKVINDIVFQTKLLSFNASVEAARAGEHGKGFAVVAEEVGNLASMSGKAALEITEMLDTSIKQVTEIVENSTKNVESLIQNGKEKVEIGTQTANQCGDALDLIQQNVSSVNQLVSEIANASSEQATGVREVTSAMQQLDEVMHQNTSVAQDSSRTSETLKEQAELLTKATNDLMGFVHGKGNSAPSQEEFKHPPKSEDGEKQLDNVKEFKRPEPVDAPSQNSAGLKVVGLDTTLPDESDPRFEDL